jgi:hypothetical protein
MLGIIPMASCILGKLSTTEPHTQHCSFFKMCNQWTFMFLVIDISDCLSIVYVVLVFEFRALYFLGRHLETTWATPPAPIHIYNLYVSFFFFSVSFTLAIWAMSPAFLLGWFFLYCFVLFCFKLGLSFCPGWPGPWSSYFMLLVSLEWQVHTTTHSYWLRWGLTNVLPRVASHIARPTNLSHWCLAIIYMILFSDF